MSLECNGIAYWFVVLSSSSMFCAVIEPSASILSDMNCTWRTGLSHYDLNSILWVECIDLAYSLKSWFSLPSD